MSTTVCKSPSMPDFLGPILRTLRMARRKGSKKCNKLDARLQEPFHSRPPLLLAWVLNHLHFFAEFIFLCKPKAGQRHQGSYSLIITAPPASFLSRINDLVPWRFPLGNVGMAQASCHLSKSFLIVASRLISTCSPIFPTRRHL